MLVFLRKYERFSTSTPSPGGANPIVDLFRRFRAHDCGVRGRSAYGGNPPWLRLPNRFTEVGSRFPEQSRSFRSRIRGRRPFKIIKFYRYQRPTGCQHSGGVWCDSHFFYLRGNGTFEANWLLASGYFSRKRIHIHLENSFIGSAREFLRDKVVAAVLKLVIELRLLAPIHWARGIRAVWCLG